MNGAGSSTPVFPGGAMGTDAFGTFVDLDVCGVVQRFRWCPPGVFWMGASEGEVGNVLWEGPRHRVRITRGFWMADTPVTQALYLAVMGNNPSYFADPDHLDRPVESVDWEEARTFCATVESLVAARGAPLEGGRFRLPTEAEWEYACRAGTEQTTYNGDLTIIGDENPPELDEIAWYVGNSGVGYFLAPGADAARWAGKPYVQARGGTRPVKQKRPNPWGLYDMLGNVCEWCADGVEFGEGYPMGESEVQEGALREDPVGQVGASHPYRGGSWGDDPRYVRAACRDADTADLRYRGLGFRLVWGPLLSEGFI